MESRATDEQLTEREQQEFTSALSRLKRRGAALLVVGNVPDRSHAEACSHMLGDDSATSRRRLFVSTDTDLPSVLDRLSSNQGCGNPKTTKRLTWHANSRSTATPTTSTQPDVPTTAVDGDGLGELGVKISEAINDFDEVTGGLSPAELRVCFDSLESLLGEYKDPAVFRFLHVLIGRLRSVHAMGHFHLRAERDSDTVTQFSELFDATIELRLANGVLQQRWHLRESKLTSDWLVL